MKTQISSIIAGLILTLATSSGLAVSAKALLGASKHADSLAESGMPLTKVSKSGLKELAEMAAVNRSGVTDVMIVQNLNSAGTGGVINKVNLKNDGTVIRIAYKIPESGVPISSIKTDHLYGDGGNRLWMARRFDLLSGRISVNDIFDIAAVNGLNLRRTLETQLLKSHFEAYLSLVPGEREVLKVTIRDGDKPAKKHLLRLPDGAKGDILHFEMSTSGSRMTVWTSHGQKFEFAVHADPHNQEVLTSRYLNVRPTPNGIKDFQAAVKIIPGRKSASANSGDVRGLEVQGSRAAQ